MAVIKEMLEIYDDKIKDKNDVIDALKASNNLYKMEYKDKTNSQAEKIKALNVELIQLKEKNSKEINKEDNIKLDASYKAILKEKDDQIMILEMDLSLANVKIKEKDDLLRHQAETLKNLNNKWR